MTAPAPDNAKNSQILSQQEKNIFAWRKQNIPGADQIRTTQDPARMLSAEGRAPSFLDKASFTVPLTDKEGAPGVYWRGVEGFPKVQEGLVPDLVVEQAKFEAEAPFCVLYTMVHGLLEVPAAILDVTQKGDISTWHDTAFIHDVIPGTLQAASTGAGHFQGQQLDVKRVVEGRGIQFNVKYGPNDRVEGVYAQLMAPGAWVLALPGHVDYVVNLGRLRFNDVSFRLEGGQIPPFQPGLKPQNLSRAPFAVALKDRPGLVPALASESDPIWIKGPELAAEEADFIAFYRSLTAEKAGLFLRDLAARPIKLSRRLK